MRIAAKWLTIAFLVIGFLTTLFIGLTKSDLKTLNSLTSEDISYYQELREGVLKADVIDSLGCDDISKRVDEVIANTKTPIGVMLAKTVLEFGTTPKGCWSSSERGHRYASLRAIAEARESEQMVGLVHLPKRLIFALRDMPEDMISSRIREDSLWACLADLSYLKAQRGEARPISDEEQNACQEAARG